MGFSNGGVSVGCSWGFFFLFLKNESRIEGFWFLDVRLVFNRLALWGLGQEGVGEGTGIV